MRKVTVITKVRICALHCTGALLCTALHQVQCNVQSSNKNVAKAGNKMQLDDATKDSGIDVVVSLAIKEKKEEKKKKQAREARRWDSYLHI